MTRPLIVILVGFTLCASSLASATLSVVPLAESLQNSALADTKSTEFAAAYEQVTRQLLNQPADKAELEAVQARVAALAAHRDTRVGKLFFAALAAVPDIENLGEAEFAAVESVWPLSFGAAVRVRVEYTRKGDAWLVSALEATAEGTAAAPLAGMAPYFGIGAPRAELLNVEAIDYLVGRDPAERTKPEADRAAFDFDAALKPIFEAEAGAFLALLETLKKNTEPGVEREKRIEAVKPHLTTEADVKAMQEADAAEQKREPFWTALREQIAGALLAPRPTRVPTADGAQVRVRYRVKGSKEEHEQSGVRLSTGKIALGG